jgi:hypothetical protein
MFRYCLNVLMGLSFISLFVTGVLKFPQFRLAFILHSWHLPWLVISRIHDWSGLILGVLILTHLWLNHRWFVARTKAIFQKKQPQ